MAAERLGEAAQSYPPVINALESSCPDSDVSFMGLSTVWRTLWTGLEHGLRKQIPLDALAYEKVLAGGLYRFEVTVSSNGTTRDLREMRETRFGRVAMRRLWC